MTMSIPSGSRVTLGSIRGIYLSHTALCPLVNNWPDGLNDPNREWGGVIPREYLEEVKDTFAGVVSFDDYRAAYRRLPHTGYYFECWADMVTLVRRPHQTRRGKHHRMRVKP